MSVSLQVEKANEQPFCQVCRELLSRVSQEDITPSVLYPIQLLLWGIKAHPSEITYPKGRSLDQLEAKLAEMSYVEPESVLVWLMYLEETEGPLLVQKEEATQVFRELTPLGAAKQLAVNLKDWWGDDLYGWGGGEDDELEEDECEPRGDDIDDEQDGAVALSPEEEEFVQSLKAEAAEYEDRGLGGLGPRAWYMMRAWEQDSPKMFASLKRLGILKTMASVAEVRYLLVKADLIRGGMPPMDANREAMSELMMEPEVDQEDEFEDEFEGDDLESDEEEDEFDDDNQTGPVMLSPERGTVLEHLKAADMAEKRFASTAQLIGSLTALSTFLAIPVMLMNLFGGIISGVWLACLGEWKIILNGLLVASFSTFAISIALMPALLFALPTAAFIERKKIGPVIALAIPATLYTVAVIAAWCYLVFSAAFGLATQRNPIPILLWSYGIATGPWSYMASKQDSGSESGASTFYAFFISLAYLLMVLMRLIGGADFATCFTAFTAIMVLVFVFQFIATVSAFGATRQAYHE